MKAIVKVRVKATGEIKEVARGIYSPYQYVDKDGTIYTEDDVEELPGDDGVMFYDPTIDYWTRLEHQAAISAMQALLSNDTMMTVLSRRDNGTMEEEVAREAFDYAHALVEKYKKEE